MFLSMTCGTYFSTFLIVLCFTQHDSVNSFQFIAGYIRMLHVPYKANKSHRVLPATYKINNQSVVRVVTSAG